MKDYLEDDDELDHRKRAIYRYDLINKIIEKRGLTDVQVSIKADMGYQTVLNVRDGRRVSLETLARIARALEIPLADLFKPRPQAKPAKETASSGAPATS